MYKLIIVDDEKITRDSLKNYIPWNELGIHIIETAKNGLVALDIAKQLKPDIILTDVRMAKMNGIELATEIRKLYPECKIIFLSGYSDKEYLKSAIKLQAINYIEKPINIHEVKATIQETVALCNTEKSKRIVSQTEKTMTLHQNIILDLINQKLDWDNFKEKYPTILPNFYDFDTYNILSIVFNPAYLVLPSQIFSIEQHILQALYTIQLPEPIHFIAGFTGDDNIAVLIGGKCNFSKQLHDETIEFIHNFILSKSDETFSFSIGVSSSFNSIWDTDESYAKATSAAKMQFYLGVNKVVYQSNLKDVRDIVYDNNVIPVFKKFLINGSTVEASNLVKEITSNFQASMDGNIDFVKNVYFNLLLTAYEVKRNGENSQKPEYNNKFLWQKIDTFITITELSNYLTSYIEISFKSNMKKNIASKRVEEIQKYIEENYGDYNLTLEEIAAHLNLSKPYLCTFFKKVTGITINEYITHLRIEQSMDLIVDFKIKLCDVANQVGFLDANYFSTLFKKVTGLTPSEFRERNQI